MPKGNRTNPPKVPRTSKENFWSKERVKQNLTIKEVADALGIKSEKIVGMWFTGQVMPADYRIKEMCELFGIDLVEGQLAFQKANMEWTAEHGKKTKYRGVNKNAKHPVSKPETFDKVNNIAEVILTIYGKISCEAFLNVYNAITDGKPGDCDIERILYSKVDFDTYQQIVAIMKS